MYMHWPHSQSIIGMVGMRLYTISSVIAAWVHHGQCLGETKTVASVLGGMHVRVLCRQDCSLQVYMRPGIDRNASCSTLHNIWAFFLARCGSLVVHACSPSHWFAQH